MEPSSPQSSTTPCARPETSPELNGHELVQWIREHGPLLDIRSAADFAAGHVLGSVHIPGNELVRRFAELPPRGAALALVGPELTPADLEELTLHYSLAPLPPGLSSSPFPHPDVKSLLEPLGLWSVGLNHGNRLWRANPVLQDMLPWLSRIAASQALSFDHPWSVLDIASGSGRDAVAIALEIPSSRIHCLDFQQPLLDRAMGLAGHHGVSSQLVTHYVDLEPSDGDYLRPLKSITSSDEDIHAGFSLVHVGRYLNRDAYGAWAEIVAPGGFILIHTFMDGAQNVGPKRPKGPKHLLQPGELASFFRDTCGMKIVLNEVVALGDGRPTSAFLAQRPMQPKPLPAWPDDHDGAELLHLMSEPRDDAALASLMSVTWPCPLCGQTLCSTEGFVHKGLLAEQWWPTPSLKQTLAPGSELDVVMWPTGTVNTVVLESVLSQAGYFSTVWSCHLKDGTQSHLALKAYHEAADTVERQLDRWHRELFTAAALTGASQRQGMASFLVDLRGYGLLSPVILMERGAAVDLSALDPGHVLSQLKNALHHFHSQGFAHGDVKLSNLLRRRGSGEIILTDLNSSTHVLAAASETGRASRSPPSARSDLVSMARLVARVFLGAISGPLSTTQARSDMKRLMEDADWTDQSDERLSVAAQTVLFLLDPKLPQDVSVIYQGLRERMDRFEN